MAKNDELSKRTRTKVRFKHDDFDFFFQYLLGGQSHGASEMGESFYAASQIKDGEPESWTTAWTELAERVEVRAKHSLERNHHVSARESYFRAYFYYRAPLLFMDPQDARYRPIYETARECFQKAAALNTPEIEFFEIPFQGGALPGYFLRPDNSTEPRKTLLMFGGGDSFVEDLYYYVGPAGTKRDYNVVIVDLPGQGILPDTGLAMRADTEVPMKSIVDFVYTYPEVDRDRLAAFGISAGGYLIPRAATVEKRIKACVACSAILNFYEVWTRNAGFERIAKLENSWLMRWIQKLPVRKVQAVSRLISTYEWRWGVDSVSDLLDVSKQFTFDPTKLSCPTLVLIGAQEYEHFEMSRTWAHKCVDGVTNPIKQLIVAPQNEGADGHAIATNLSLMSQLVFDWLDEVFE